MSGTNGDGNGNQAEPDGATAKRPENVPVEQASNEVPPPADGEQGDFVHRG